MGDQTDGYVHCAGTTHPSPLEYERDFLYRIIHQAGKVHDFKESYFCFCAKR